MSDEKHAPEPWELVPYESDDDLPYYMFINRGSHSTVSGAFRPSPPRLVLTSDSDPMEQIEIKDVAALDELVARLLQARVWLAAQSGKTAPPAT